VDDKEATRRFYALVWPQRAAVLRLARLLCASADAEDLAQETLLKAFRKIDTFRDGSDIKAWLLAILRNTRIDNLRATASEASVSLSDLAAEPADQSESQADSPVGENPQAFLDEFSDQQIIEALQELPEEIRWTLLLTDVEQMSQKDAAELLQVPVGTIKSRVHRGHLMLRERLLPMARERRLVRD